MGRSHPNPLLVKIHRTYTLDEASRTLGVCKATVRSWIEKGGLVPIDKGRPTLLQGTVLRTFLQTMRAQSKQPSPAGHMYCFRCRVPRFPLDGIADYRATSPTQGRLEAICPVCVEMMYRTASLATLERAKGTLEVSMPSTLLHINDSSSPHVKCNLKEET